MYPQTTSLYSATVVDSTTYCRDDDDIIVVDFDGEEPGTSCASGLVFCDACAMSSNRAIALNVALHFEILKFLIQMQLVRHRNIIFRQDL